ncbi:hypothetical protein PKF032_03150 [Polynucleobacter yangtzensis]|uniref:Glycosidase n=1 Tax=Polynucleobacter yangtzensis TaxID=1743159 RepID=A0ABN6TP94_9BURK|nr:hypothetical protein PKF032_03150 [Polynucleobacter yangtzensis]
MHAQIVVSGTPFLSDYDTITRIKLNLDLPNFGFNPGLLKLSDGYLMVVRCRASNCFNDQIFIHNPDAPVDVNYLIYLNEEYQITKKIVLDESIFVRDGSPWTPPLEDIRIFTWGNEVWMIGAIHDRGARKIEQALCKIQDDAIVQYQVLASPVGLSVEKNWIPVPIDGKLNLIYSFDPFQVMSMVSPTGNLKADSIQADEGDHPFRGGTTLVPYGSGYVALVHAAPMEYRGARLYTHHFVLFNKDLQLAEIGRPFFIEHHGIEFAVGIVAQEDGVLISYAVGDRVTRLMKIPNAVIEKFLSVE